jgi:type 1 glutamine amidotransferase
VTGGTGTTGGTATGGTATGTGGTATGGTGGATNTGPFKILILSTALEFPHDSIPNCQYMLGLESAKATAVKDWAQATPISTQWTADLATDDLAQFTDATLKNYAMVFSCSPTGTVFSNNPKVKDKNVAMSAFQHFVENGGAWGGIHSATDFENKNGFPWFTNILAGAYFVTHDADGTSGTVQLDSTNKTHPALAGLQATYSTSDEWYKMNRDVSAQPGFLILQRLASDNRPITWAKEIANPNGGTGGRMFNTVRGHNKKVYQESEFRKTVLQGILWATRRM